MSGHEGLDSQGDGCQNEPTLVSGSLFTQGKVIPSTNKGHYVSIRRPRIPKFGSSIPFGGFNTRYISPELVKPKLSKINPKLLHKYGRLGIFSSLPKSLILLITDFSINYPKYITSLKNDAISQLKLYLNFGTIYQGMNPSDNRIYSNFTFNASEQDAYFSIYDELSTDLLPPEEADSVSDKSSITIMVRVNSRRDIIVNNFIRLPIVAVIKNYKAVKPLPDYDYEPEFADYDYFNPRNHSEDEDDRCKINRRKYNTIFDSSDSSDYDDKKRKPSRFFKTKHKRDKVLRSDSIFD